MADRFELPLPGPSAALRFPAIEREELANGLRVWFLPHAGVPAVSAALIIAGGTAGDPPDRPGLAGLVADLADEGAAGRDAIALADAFSRLGGRIELEVGPDVTAMSITSLSRFLTPVFTLAADIIARPHLAETDLTRVRELRTSRVRQLSRSAAAAADRVFLGAVLAGHPYGHGALGTTRSLEAVSLQQAREFWASTFAPRRATLVVAGEAPASEVMSAAAAAFGSWSSGAGELAPVPAPVVRDDPRVLVVDRPGAPQSELRVGHLGPAREVDDYHALVTLNAVLGGQFTSRINRNLRETRAITYGARTSFDMRRAGGTFACDTSVQGDATATAVREMLAEMRNIQDDGSVSGEELEAAKASLTRGYVRHFETAAHLVRAMTQLVTYGLDPGVFDRFVPEVDAVTSADLTRVARRFLRPDAATIVVAGEARHTEPLADLGREIVTVVPEF
jgi:zinc protease